MSRSEWVGVVAICATIGISASSTNARIDDLRVDLQADIQDIRADIRDIRSDIAEIRADVNEIRADVDEIRKDVNDIRTDLDDIRSDVDEMNRALGAHIAGHQHDSGPA